MPVQMFFSDKTQGEHIVKTALYKWTPASPNTEIKELNVAQRGKAIFSFLPYPEYPASAPTRPRLWQEFLRISRHWWHDGPQGAMARSYGYDITGGWVEERHLHDLLFELYRELDMWFYGKIQHLSIQSHSSPNLHFDTKLWTRLSNNVFAHATIQSKSCAANPWTVN